MADVGKPEAVKASPVSEDELQIAFSGPAIASNKVYVTLSPGGIRIAFTEQRTSAAQPSFRSAVMMNFQDAIALRNLLSQILANVEPELEKAIAASKMDK
jgi:hypothetical protein